MNKILLILLNLLILPRLYTFLCFFPKVRIKRLLFFFNLLNKRSFHLTSSWMTASLRTNLVPCILLIFIIHLFLVIVIRFFSFLFFGYFLFCRNMMFWQVLLLYFYFLSTFLLRFMLFWNSLIYLFLFLMNFVLFRLIILNLFH